ncbi:adenine nucleotide alpha hydrolases-like protein [Panus rudis PR-1116 ss-1]|nr:adenine nucleotide alpha hydrolases-like protein [Panus rudis PR-1116 ss-1]
MSSSDRPVYIPIPPLRSAMKHTSRPSTPSGAQSPNSPPYRSSPLSPMPSGYSSIADSPAQGTPASLFSPPQSPSASTVPLVAAQGYEPKVSFDTFENPQASMFSYTLHVQNEGYKRSRQTRSYLCASSPDESGTHALEWALEALVQDGDELIVFRGIDTEDLEKDHDLYREEARELMRQIQEKCLEYDPERKLSIIVEYIAGKITDTIDRLIALYRPDSVVVGTRGQRGVMQAWGAAFGGPGVGSVSKYCLSHSPVPVIVVRPESKVRKAIAKRRADPKRGNHFNFNECVLLLSYLISCRLCVTPSQYD